MALLASRPSFIFLCLKLWVMLSAHPTQGRDIDASVSVSSTVSSNPTCQSRDFAEIVCPPPNVCYYVDQYKTPGCCPAGHICIPGREASEQQPNPESTSTTVLPSNGTDRSRDIVNGGTSQSGGGTNVATAADIAGSGGGTVNVANSLTLINEGHRGTRATRWLGQTVLSSFLVYFILG